LVEYEVKSYLRNYAVEKLFAITTANIMWLDPSRTVNAVIRVLIAGPAHVSGI